MTEPVIATAKIGKLAPGVDINQSGQYKITNTQNNPSLAFTAAPTKQYGVVGDNPLSRVLESTVINSDYNPESVAKAREQPDNPAANLYVATYDNLVRKQDKRYAEAVQSGDKLSEIVYLLEGGIVGAAASVPAIAYSLTQAGSNQRQAAGDKIHNEIIPGVVEGITSNPIESAIAIGSSLILSKRLPTKLPGITKVKTSPSTTTVKTSPTTTSPGTAATRTTTTTVKTNPTTTSPGTTAKTTTTTTVKTNPTTTSPGTTAKTTTTTTVKTSPATTSPGTAAARTTTATVKTSPATNSPGTTAKTTNLKITTPEDFLRNQNPVSQTPKKTISDVIKEQNAVKIDNKNVVFPREAITGLNINSVTRSRVTSLPNVVSSIKPIPAAAGAAIRTPISSASVIQITRSTPNRTFPQTAATTSRTPEDPRFINEFSSTNPYLKILSTATKGIISNTINTAKYIKSLPARLKKTDDMYSWRAKDSSTSTPKRPISQTAATTSRTPEDPRFINEFSSTNPYLKILSTATKGIISNTINTAKYIKSLPARMKKTDDLYSWRGNKSGGSISGGSGGNVFARMNAEDAAAIAAGGIGLFGASAYASTRGTKTATIDEYPINPDKQAWDETGNRRRTTSGGGNTNKTGNDSGEVIIDSTHNQDEIKNKNQNGNETPNNYKPDIDYPTHRPTVVVEIDPTIDELPSEIKYNDWNYNSTTNDNGDENSSNNKNNDENNNKNNDENGNRNRNRTGTRNVYDYEYIYETSNKRNLKRRKLTDGKPDKNKKKSKSKKYSKTQVTNYIPWLSDDDVGTAFNWLKRDLRPLKNTGKTAAAKKAISAYNAAAKTYNAARKKYLPAAKDGNRTAYQKLKTLYKAAMTKKAAVKKNSTKKISTV